MPSLIDRARAQGLEIEEPKLVLPRHNYHQKPRIQVTTSTANSVKWGASEHIKPGIEAQTETSDSGKPWVQYSSGVGLLCLFGLMGYLLIGGLLPFKKLETRDVDPAFIGPLADHAYWTLLSRQVESTDWTSTIAVLVCCVVISSTLLISLISSVRKTAE